MTPTATATATAAMNTTGSRDVIRRVTYRVLAMAADELGKDDTQRHIRTHVVDPLIKMLHAHLVPYLVIAMVLIISILLISMMTLVLSAMFYFKRSNFA